MGAACALALICACVSPRAGLAQTSSASSPAESPKPKAKTTSSQKHKKVATGSKAKSPAPTTKSKSSAAAPGTKSKSASSKRTSRKRTARGQQKIDSERAQEIQEALIREHYLSGHAAGTWNQASEDAMRRYQADHGWQSKTVPDSRALISLGLGPSHDHLLNPESAMTTGPASPRAASLTPTSHSPNSGAGLSTPPAANSDQVPVNAPAHEVPNPQ
jgi:hypothetical protein